VQPRPPIDGRTLGPGYLAFRRSANSFRGGRLQPFHLHEMEVTLMRRELRKCHVLERDRLVSRVRDDRIVT
jgi:hypothetical protein